MFKGPEGGREATVFLLLPHSAATGYSFLSAGHQGQRAGAKALELKGPKDAHCADTGLEGVSAAPGPARPTEGKRLQCSSKKASPQKM